MGHASGAGVTEGGESVTGASVTESSKSGVSVGTSEAGLSVSASEVESLDEEGSGITEGKVVTTVSSDGEGTAGVPGAGVGGAMTG